MSQISKKFAVAAAAIPLVVLLAAAVDLSLHKFYSDYDGGVRTPLFADISRLSTYRIPDSLNFCGENMPLGTPDVRHRMEQAFYIELSDAQIILDLKRSREYFPYIEKKIKEMNLPSDLRFLPVAESALRNLVSSRGAAGIWQFTPQTARRYGLKVNYFVDERYNFRKATVAALNYLNDLHTQFGSWTLAAAAYNMGTTGIERTARFQMTKNYYHLRLNDETAHFVFRIVALKQIISHYKKYGFDLGPDDFYHAPEIRTVNVGYLPNLAFWARRQGTSYNELKLLNPWLTRNALPHGNWEIDLPETTGTALAASDSGSSDSAKDSLSQVSYLVKPGDSLTRIAENYGVTIGDLARWNDLSGDLSLRSGQKLKIRKSDRTIEREDSSN